MLIKHRPSEDIGLDREGCHRNERRFPIGRDRGVPGVRPSREVCVRRPENGIQLRWNLTNALVLTEPIKSPTGASFKRVLGSWQANAAVSLERMERSSGTRGSTVQVHSSLPDSLLEPARVNDLETGAHII